ncbi:mitochondrial carrier [Fomitiporia mediterranea MF3/22]|uniref:mitochondrial carrier n=1 Tax=Fomitiporia mediterranea (strain MF3/22) TaxID=694068 RepID=UPI0004408046|nr:mitochondrial carrier [Fomitiporia mediterranea MF3/22]EJD04423.1 mitochondrial carrier [Fomitiporia mediterranea MF3/22]
MSASSGSLRDLYSDPPTAWSFVPITNNGSNPASGAGGPSIKADSASTSYQWSSRPRPNSIYELSPDLDFEPSGPNAVAFLRTAAASAILQYLAAALENPWEVGNTLLEVQFVPRNAGVIEEVEPPEEEEETSDDTSSANGDNYFADEADSFSSRTNTPRPVDEHGYVVRQGVSESATRPDWVIPPGSVAGVWQMMKQLMRWKPEGYLALWKGTATGCIRTFLDGVLQPIIQSALTHLFSAFTLAPSPSFYSRAHPILLPVASHVFTGFLLSPLDLIRTRLIVQTSHPRHRRYSGPLDALNQILLHEGGIHGIYLHPQLLYSTILDCTLSSLASALVPTLTARVFRRISGMNAEEVHPLLWILAQLGGACASLLITVPMGTIRRRLQIQTRGSAPPLATCVEVRRRPYAGIVDAFYSILTEERSDLPLHPKKRERRMSRAHEKGKAKEGKVHEEPEEQESWLKHTGIGQLYRGLSMRAGASVVIFLSSFLTAGSNESGWTEL